ncbi:MAG: nitroreductase family protein [Sphaerochaetaceae bacterium]|nr:nitroreductase family protein [Sphaerochaetaceae bacterium]
MRLLDAIEMRRAYRAFSEEILDRDTLTRLAMAAHTAPSSMNNQPWRMITVTDSGKLDALRETLGGGNYWAKKAPAITAFLTNPAWSMTLGGREYAFFELGMAAMAYQMQAVSEGLYVHPMAGFNVTGAKKVLGIADEDILEVLMAVGKPGDSTHLNEKHLESENSPRIRKPLEEVMAYDAWHERLRPQSKG